MTRPEPQTRSLADELTSWQLRYLGEMTASLSHELRNGLAVINEKNGLIADMMAMAARGKPPNEARLGQLAADVARRVREASEVCDRLSRLAHTADEPTRVVELGTIVELVTRLMARLARRSKVELVLEPADPVNVEVEPVLLQLAIQLCLAWALEHGALDRVGITVGKAARSTAVVRLTGPSWRGVLTDRPAPLTHVLDALGAALEAGARDDEILLLVPTTLGGGREGEGRP